MSAVIENNELVIRVPLQAPAESKSGKSNVVASTGGFLTTDAQVDGKPVKINVTGIIAK